MPQLKQQPTRNDTPYALDSQRKKDLLLRSQLSNEIQSFIAHWREISNVIDPHRPRFTTADVNRGERRNRKIIDSTAGMAVRTFVSGMQAGMTSPVRPWMRVQTPYPDLNEYASVKWWCDQVSTILLGIYRQSNFYVASTQGYKDLGVRGTSGLWMEEDMEDVVRFESLPTGSFMISNNARGVVDTMFRDFNMTVRQIVEKFLQRKGYGKSGGWDWSNMSKHVKDQWDRGNYETWIAVSHVVQPNPKHDPTNPLAKFKKYRSCYFELGQTSKGNANYMGSENNEGYLRESGYDIFPGLFARWDVNGEDTYATDCPGMMALGDINALQIMQKRKAQAVEKKINPAMTGPTSMKNARASLIAGDITYVDNMKGQEGFRPAHEVNLDVREVREDIRETQNIIRRAFYEDLFLMFVNDDRRDITAEEIRAKQEEKLFALGPVLGRVDVDWLNPQTLVTFRYALRQGLIPPPPPELEGVPLQIEYVSVMAQAQKLVGIGGLERFANFMGTLVKVTGDPSVKDKWDVDQHVDEYADRLGVPPRVVRSDEDVAEIRRGRQQAERAAALAQNAPAMAKTAKDLSQAKLTGDSALDALVDTGT